MIFAASLLAGCGGGGSGGSGDSIRSAPNASALIQFSANPTQVSSGGRATLSWTAHNATSCTASGGWSGSKATSGSFKTPAVTRDTTFTLDCRGVGVAGGGAVARLTVRVGNGQNAANVSLKSVPGSVAVKGSSRLEWASAGADHCDASGDWSGRKSPAGSQVVSGITKDSSFKLTCTKAGKTGVAMTSVVLRRATLRWNKPSASVAGFHVFWGTSAHKREHKITIKNTTARERVIDLPGPGTYYFAMAAYDAKGVDSARSNEVSKLIPH